MQINEVEELTSKHVVGANHSNSIISVCITFNRTILVTNVNLYFFLNLFKSMRYRFMLFVND